MSKKLGEKQWDKKSERKSKKKERVECMGKGKKVRGSGRRGGNKGEEMMWMK